MRRATAVVGGGYGASRDDGGSDQGSVVVRARQVQAAVEAEKLELFRASLGEGEYEMTK